VKKNSCFPQIGTADSTQTPPTPKTVKRGRTEEGSRKNGIALIPPQQQRRQAINNHRTAAEQIPNSNLQSHPAGNNNLLTSE